MEETAAQGKTLKELRTERKANGKSRDFKQLLKRIFRWDSLFYYAVFALILGFLWAIYPLSTNSFTQLLNFDYTWQYVPFTYDYWDAWHTFFRTGQFPLYDGAVFMGTDMIGSGSYYGLFDPFMFICYLLPRAWIPSTYAVMTYVKFMVAALLMRTYLKSMGIKEWTARIGGIIYTFSGFTTWFISAPNFHTAMTFFPLILLGIEKVLKKQSPVALSLGIFFLAVSCFFYVPVLCIFGVIYAGWRFVATFKTRELKDQFIVIGLGVAGFAVGLALSAISFIPSMRETMLSGRSSSIGSAYFTVIKQALKDKDLTMLFSYMFEEVGDHPAREMMGPITFFFPTGGWTSLPMAQSGYDAWTSSLYCFTPCVILTFVALINSIRLRKWSHLVAVLLCVFATMTNVSYFLFFGFSGNGYGRWFLILIPLIVFYSCWAFDLRHEMPRWIPLTGVILAFVGTISMYHVIEHVLGVGTFPSSVYNVHDTTYWRDSYVTSDRNGGPQNTTWYLYYQCCLVIIEGFFFVVGQKRKWLPMVLLGLVSAEVVVMGNLSYAFNGTWSYETGFAGGERNRESSLVMTNAINQNDSSFFRTQSDTYGNTDYSHNVFGTNATMAFHSLMNFEVETFAVNNQMKIPNNGDRRTTYGGIEVYNPPWSGRYMNKRYVTDTLLAYRYYIVENSYYRWKNQDGSAVFLPANVPFGSVEMESYSPNRDVYRVYRRGEDSLPQLGYAVDSNLLFRLKQSQTKSYINGFYTNQTGRNNFLELEHTQWVELNGAIIEDNVVLPGNFVVRDEVPSMRSDLDLYQATGLTRLAANANGLSMYYYETEADDGLFPSDSKDYRWEGLGYFVNHYKVLKRVTGPTTCYKDVGKIVITPSNSTLSHPTTFNTDPRGCYFEFAFNGPTNAVPRVYAIGDRVDDNGNVIETNACLGFDNNLFNNMNRDGFYGAYAHTFGLYARGLVKYFVMCVPGSGAYTTSTSYLSMIVKEYGEIEQEEVARKANSLKDVKRDVNSFSFYTDYTEPRIVVTQLGYHEGWNAKAKMPDGSEQKCPVLRLDGGLVGFVAPAAVDGLGNPLPVYYVLDYKTPLSGYSIALWAIGVVMFASFVAVPIIVKKKKRKQRAS